MVAAMVWAGGCTARSEQGLKPIAKTLLVRPSFATLRAGETIQLTVQVNDSANHPVPGAPIVFEARENGIARVSEHGLLSAFGAVGRDSILVRSGTLSRYVDVTVIAGKPSRIEIIAGAGQSGSAGSPLPVPVTMIVRDAFGNAVPRAAVALRAPNGGSAMPASLMSDLSGAARAIWTLGPLAGVQTLSVSADSASASVDAYARAGAMAHVQDIDPVSRRTFAGDSVGIRLRAVDDFGNGVADVVFAYSVEAGGGAVTPARIETDSTGMANTRWRTGIKAGANVLLVRAFQQRDTTFRRSIVTVGGAPAKMMLVSDAVTRGRPGEAVARSPVVRVVDRYSNPSAAVRVRFLPSSPSSVVDPSEVVTDDLGRATLHKWILGPERDQLLSIVADGIADTVRVRARVSKP